MSKHKEISFEAEICSCLEQHDWLYDDADVKEYDRGRALFAPDVFVWIRETQQSLWQTLVKKFGTSATDEILNRLRDQLDKRGTLDVLRNGIEMMGLKQPLKLAEFKPALSANADILKRYELNRLRVIRQVHYSLNNENSIDLVLFLNGIPVATVELKTDFTQSIQDAVDQYRFDRLPYPKGQSAEPLLKFPSGAVVHFAVSNAEVQLTTKLDGPATVFLPFNQGNDGAAGNPVNPAGGHRTAYLWEKIWERESWLEILGRYVMTKKDAKKQIDKFIFPRFHQLDVTRKLQAAVIADGTGGKYLVQHSAGSGKTNSIAWTAHLLAELHNAKDEKVFDTVLVVSDRNVIDTQLQEAIFDFQKTTGVVATITNQDGSKSKKLANALSGAKKVVVCTIQTFPFAIDAVRELAATQGKRFAVIADEAHSSQTGDAAAQLKILLSSQNAATSDDGEEVSSEDVLLAKMFAKADDSGITFVAFTATPKNKTLELFGTLPDATKPASETNLPAPFHVYSMRQAIEEGFILDVLQNYTPYSLAFKLASDGKELDQKQVEKSAALKKIMGWVKLHPYNIAQKVQVVVEHFRESVAPLLNGKAKAMVVVGSRKEAVRWQLATEKYIRERGYTMGTLVAFSGEVVDPESGPDPFTEHSASLNPRLKGDIREAFKGSDYQLLLVANKFQTGFDQPLLCGMYVDKKLSGIQAVQTLSRLNRAYPGKDTTFVLDFVNEPLEVLEAFKTYYATAELSGVTDPNLVYDLRQKLDAAGYYDDFEVDRVVVVELNANAKQGDLVAALEPVYSRLMSRFREARQLLEVSKAKDDAEAIKDAKAELDALFGFKKDMGTYIRLYTFLSQIFDFGNTAVEKRAMFYKRLLPLLDFGRERESIDVSKLKLTHHTLKKKAKATMVLADGDAPKLSPVTEAGSGSVQEKERALLAEIIEKVNDLFEGELSDQDKLVYVNNVIMGKLLESTKLAQQAASNSKQQFGNSPELSKELTNAIIDALDAHKVMSTQALGSKAVQDGIKDILLNHSNLWEALRSRSAIPSSTIKPK